eukprot:405868-Amorphochlora_amoeboformis.AAC.1
MYNDIPRRGRREAAITQHQCESSPLMDIRLQIKPVEKSLRGSWLRYGEGISPSDYSSSRSQPEGWVLA